jgi:arginase
MQTMSVNIIAVPYDSGQRAIRMGLGPEHLLENGLARALHNDGHEVSVERVGGTNSFWLEVQTSFELYALLATQVAAARRIKAFPLVLSGNCGSALGTLAGVRPERTGVIWLDAHGDFNTPETTLSGFLDGQALAIATGRCWKPLAASIPGFRPVDDRQVVLVGARDFDPIEKAMLEISGVTLVNAGHITRAGAGEALEPALSALQPHVDRIYFHLDLDVLDPTEAVANQFAAPGGLSVAHVEEIISLVGERFEICAAALTAYDPDYDPDGRALHAGLRLARSLVNAARK